MNAKRKRLGRPPKTLDQSRIIELAAKGCSVRSIAAYLSVAESTLHARFSEALKKGRGLLEGDILQKQAQMARKGDKTMLIWLGKQICEQRDHHEVTGKAGGPLVLKFITRAARPERGN